MFKHITRRLGVLIIVFISSSLVLLSYVYFIQKNKSSADVQPTEEVSTSGESVFVGACSDPLKCEGILPGDTLHFIQNPILSIFMNHIEPKFASLTNSCVNQVDQAGIKPDNLPPDGHVVIGGCDLTFQKVNDPIIDRDLYKVLFNLTVDKTVKSQLPTTYKDNTYDNSGLEKIDIIFKTNRQQYVYLFYLPDGLNPGFGIASNPAPEVVKLSGIINSPFVISIDGKEDMKNYLQLWNDNSDIKIDLDNSYWYSKSEGEIDGFIKASFDTSSVFPTSEEIKLDKLEVCPNGCSIKLLETF